MFSCLISFDDPVGTVVVIPGVTCCVACDYVGLGVTWILVFGQFR